jgi:hypothetical protein
MVKGTESEHFVDYSIERVNPNWCRWYLLGKGDRFLVGAERPKYIIDKLMEYYSSWPGPTTCILVFAETHNCLYGKVKNGGEAEFMLQDKNAGTIMEKTIRRDNLLAVIREIEKRLISLGASG